MAVAKKTKVKKTKRTISPSEGASVIDPSRVKDYEVNKVKAKDGSMKRTVDNGDPIAIKLRGKTIDELKDIATKAGVGDRLKKWSSLNLGMFRMNLGNVLRGIENQKAKKKAEKEAA